MSNQIRDWLHSHSDAQREALAAKAKTSVAYLWQLAGEHRKPSLEMASRLNEASGGELTLVGMRPDLSSLLTQTKRRRKAA